MARSLAAKRYNSRLLWLSLAYAAGLVGAVYAFKHQFVEGSLAYVLAALPAVAIIGIFAAIGRYLIEEDDEYVRMLMVRQTLWASGFALSLATIWGFLESFGLAGHVEAFYIAPAWFVGLGLGAAINRYTRGWSQQDLAEKLEVSRQSVNAIETGKYDPSLPLAFRIAETFALSIEQVFVSPSRRRSGAI
jgi:DNA-binding XRE family transcriptional regulator